MLEAQVEDRRARGQCKLNEGRAGGLGLSDRLVERGRAPFKFRDDVYGIDTVGAAAEARADPALPPTQ